VASDLQRRHHIGCNLTPDSHTMPQHTTHSCIQTQTHYGEREKVGSSKERGRTVDERRWVSDTWLQSD